MLKSQGLLDEELRFPWKLVTNNLRLSKRIASVLKFKEICAKFEPAKIVCKSTRSNEELRPRLHGTGPAR